MEKDKEFEAIIKRAKIELKKLGFDELNIFGIFAYGSQNYELDTVYSDWDVKVIVFPTLKNLIQNEEISITCEDVFRQFLSGDLEIKSIKKYLDLWKKGNPTYLEILKTKYKWINPNWKHFWDKINSFKIDKMNLESNVKAVYGIAKQKEKALTHPYSGIAKQIKTCGYDPKQLHHIMRLKYILEKMAETKNCSSNDFLIPCQDEKEKLIKFKTDLLQINDAIIVAKNAMKKMEVLKEKALLKVSKFDENIYNNLLNIINEMMFEAVSKTMINTIDNK